MSGEKTGRAMDNNSAADLRRQFLEFVRARDAYVAPETVMSFLAHILDRLEQLEGVTQNDSADLGQ